MVTSLNESYDDIDYRAHQPQFKIRKRPCISRTFSHKIEAKNQGCGLSTDTAVSGVLKNLINIHKTSQDVKK